ncbi:MAG: LysR family transcriptional regulator [Rhodobacteraceae bacterium]|nr:LysR family transcriptional regulator [Paracoccaceae bacterium]
MININLKRLRYFEALAQHGHFGRAAEASAVTQPALSMQIKELEETLGHMLFERGARAVMLTGFGEEFAFHAREILRRVDDLGDLARTARGRLLGRLRLGVIPTIAPYLLPTIVRELANEFPGLDLQVRETLTANLVQELVEGRIDTAIVALPISEPSFQEVALFNENFLLVRTEDDAGKPVPDAAMLREMRLLLLEDGHCFRDQALSFCNIQSGLTRDGLDASSLSTLVQMVAAGIGVTLIPEMAVPVETRSAPVSIARFADPQPARIVGMIWRRTSPLAKQLGEISESIRRSVEIKR